jgi:uncharacterized pyridoxamine 5'-phosphate oxidase family protein
MSNSIEELRKITWNSLQDCQVVFLATLDGDQPRVRPVTLMRKGNDLFTVTAFKSQKLKQIAKNRRVEFSFMIPDIGFNSIRVECLAEIVEDKKIRAETYNSPEHALIKLAPTKFIVIVPPSFEPITLSPA